MKKIIMWDLAVPWEEYVEEAHEEKKIKYDELLETCKNDGWNASCTPIEVIAQRGLLQCHYAS